MSEISLTSNAETRALDACKINTFWQINLKAIKIILEQKLSMIGRDGWIFRGLCRNFNRLAIYNYENYSYKS